MDGITLDHLIAELRESLLGRHLGRPKAAAPHAVVFEVSGERDRRLWLDATRGMAGLYLLKRDEVRALENLASGEIPGRSRQALLLLRKHLEGRRVTALHRIAGERTVVLEAGAVVLVLRVSGPAPALTLAVDGDAVSTVGEGPPAWPLPAPAPGREWDHLDPATLKAALEGAVDSGRTPARAVLAACPTLGPLLARELAGSGESFEALRARLASPIPTLLVPGPLERCRDADLATEGAVALAPLEPGIPGGTTLRPPSWLAAASLFLELRRRGMRFEASRRTALSSVRGEIRRLGQLESHLRRDLAALPDAEALRRQAEALLAAAAVVRSGVSEAEVPDPYDPERRLRIRMDPALDAPANATRLFDKARRISRSRRQIEARLAEARDALDSARARESRLLEAREISEIDAAAVAERPKKPGAGAARKAAPRRYLSSHGLSILVGRSARENHQLTFTVARPEDLWLHARDVPGAHVILRDNEGRASANDLREAAEVAAFFSEARTQAPVDVHVARRKFVRPARGTPGRVLIAHSDTLRVTPRDPEGRLRKR